MTTPGPEMTPKTPRAALLALVLSLAALGVALAHWALDRRQASATTMVAADSAIARRLSALETRLQRERADLDRLATRIGDPGTTGSPLAERVAALEAATSRMGEAGGSRSTRLVEQAAHFMRIAAADIEIAADAGGALAALAIADDYLRDAADPRLADTRRRLAGEMAALRALPAVDVGSLTLKLDALAATLPDLPRRQQTPAGFTGDNPAPPADLAPGERAWRALRDALAGIVSVRRTDEPAPTLLSTEGEAVLAQSLAVELQLARLALLRGEHAAFRVALTSVRSSIERYFDPASREVAAAVTLLDEIAATPLPDQLPDLAGSLAELIRYREAVAAP